MAYFSRILSTLGAYAVLASPVMAQEAVVSQPPIWAAKPDIVAFEKMENDRLSRAQQAIDALIAVKGAPTIDNTLALFDDAILQLDNAANFARLVEAAHPNATYRDHGSAMNGKVNAAVTALALNRDVYEALARLDLSNADPATRFYVQRRLLTSRLAGVDQG
jgi:thimet oligopeptidase